MVFSSIVFVSVFFPVVFLLHWILPDIRVKNTLLIIASLLFYAYGEPIYVLLMIGSVFVNYLLGRLCNSNENQILCGSGEKQKLCGSDTADGAGEKTQSDRARSGISLAVHNVKASAQSEKRRRKAALLLAILWNIGLLAVFKYAGFLVQLLNGTGLVQLPVPQIELPIGISFFTFQALSYVIDVYRKSVKPQKNFFKVLLYISFFPQLIAGPIVKYHDMEREIDERKVTLEGTAYGMRRFAAGLSKKVLLSNVLGLTVDTLFAADMGSINIVTAWIAAISYLLQIYFDFSGYSDMALGMGEMFGFHFKENFNYPYVADSIQEFWRRWHMSLSGWFREYLYIPLGGNRKGRVRTVINKIIVFFCTGLWHGANSTFVVWGLYHGLFLMLEEYLPRQKVKSRLVSVAKHVYTILVVTVGFVIFRGDTMMQGLFFVREMFTGFHFESAAMSLAVQQLTPLYLVVLAAAVVTACPVKLCIYGAGLCEKLDENKSDAKGLEVGEIPKKENADLKIENMRPENMKNVAHRKNRYERMAWFASAAGLILCMLSLSGSTYNPFIYFRF